MCSYPIITVLSTVNHNCNLYSIIIIINAHNYFNLEKTQAKFLLIVLIHHHLTVN